ncbi:MAG: hypothetical protein V5A79_04695 [Candidatus Bipolaricaulota bacterium]|nr:hypothetical protein [Candidatus Bipolaricaulota bacterium]
MKKIILLTIVLSIFFSLAGTAKNEEELSYLFKTYLGKDSNLERIALYLTGNQHSAFNASNKFTQNVVIEGNIQEYDLGKEFEFSHLIKKSSPLTKEFEAKNKNFLLLFSTGAESKSILSKEEKTRFTLTGFSLNSKNYTLTLGSANYFSWDAEGWISNDPDPLFSGYLSSSNDDYSGEGEGIYLELLSNELSDQFEDDER